jgi:hypothetical protein
MSEIFKDLGGFPTRLILEARNNRIWVEAGWVCNLLPEIGEGGIALVSAAGVTDRFRGTGSIFALDFGPDLILESFDEGCVEVFGEGGLDIGTAGAIFWVEEAEMAESVDVFFGQQDGDDAQALFSAAMGAGGAFG